VDVVRSEALIACQPLTPQAADRTRQIAIFATKRAVPIVGSQLTIPTRRKLVRTVRTKVAAHSTQALTERVDMRPKSPADMKFHASVAGGQAAGTA